MAKYMYFVFAEKQANAQRHVFCTLNENHGFARASVTYAIPLRFRKYALKGIKGIENRDCWRLSCL